MKPRTKITALAVTAAIAAAPGVAPAQELDVAGAADRAAAQAQQSEGVIDDLFEQGGRVLQSAPAPEDAVRQGEDALAQARSAFDEGRRAVEPVGGPNPFTQVLEDGADAASRGLQGDDDELLQAWEDIEQAFGELLGGQQAAENR